MGGYNPNNYDDVESRLRKFWADNPDGRTHTQLVHHGDGQFIVRAELFRHRDDPIPTSTGYAEEHVAAKGVNQTSALENCETSALGRALANWRYSAKARPSQTEMEKAERYAQQARNGAQQPPARPQRSKDAKDALEELDALCEAMGYDVPRVEALFAELHKGSNVRNATTPQHAEMVRAFTAKLDEVDPTRIKAPAAATNGAG